MNLLKQYTIEEEPTVDEIPKKDKLKQIVKCPDCNMDMTQHTLKYIHKRRGFCKAEKIPEQPVPEPETQKPKITEGIVNDYIKRNPAIVANYLRNERPMKAQRKHMHVRSLLNNAFLILLFCFMKYNKRCRIRTKQLLVQSSLIS